MGAVSTLSNTLSNWFRALPIGWRRAAICAALVVVVAVIFREAGFKVGTGRYRDMDMSSQSRRVGAFYRPTDSEWASIATEPVTEQSFHSERVTEGKIAVDDDLATPIFSPYAGRVIKILARPGDAVAKGQPLFVVEATDAVQAQNDYITAVAGVSKAQSSLSLAQIEERRSRSLYDTKAISQREWQQAQVALTAAQNDLRSAEIALDAVRNRLRILGRSDEEITSFQEHAKISPETPIVSPIAGTVVQRKVGPGQYVVTGATDPAFIIGDLSKVWLTAYVRETDAAQVEVGQDMSFTVLAFPDRVFSATIDYVSTALDPTIRRLLVRATVDNPKDLLKPEMFASVSILTGGHTLSPAVPRGAVIHESNTARVWIAHHDTADNNTIELRYVKTGLVSGDLVQILDGLSPGEMVVTKGSLFIDRTAGS